MLIKFCVNVFDMDVDGKEDVAIDDVDVDSTVALAVVVTVVDASETDAVSVVCAVDEVACIGTLAAKMDGANARELDVMLGITRSTPGTIAAGIGGVAGNGDIGSLVGKSGGRISGNLL